MSNDCLWFGISLDCGYCSFVLITACCLFVFEYLVWLFVGVLCLVLLGDLVFVWVWGFVLLVCVA